MALAVPQIRASARTTATQIQRAYLSAVGAGSLLVAHGAVFNSGGTPEGASSFLSDSVNGTWVVAVTSGYATSGDADSEVYLWSFPNSAAGTPTVTMNPTGTSSDNDLTLFEITGAATTTPLDTTVTATGTSATSAVTTGTLAQAAEIVISSVSHTGGWSGFNADWTVDTGDGFTQADINANNSSGQAFQVQYKITAVTTTLTVNATGGGSSGSWFTGVASYKQASSSQDTPELYGRPAGNIGQRQMHQLLAQ